MELQVSEITALQPITFNYDELKAQLIEKISTYRNLVYSEENIALAKKDRATLHKLSKAFSDERKRIKNQLLEPFNDFELKCKELEAIVDEASKNIDVQVKAFEEKEDNAKELEIVKYFTSVVGEYNELIDFDLIFDKRWLNKTCSMEKVKQDIDHIIAMTKVNMVTIDAQVQDEEINKQVKDFYFRNMNNPSVLGLALQEGTRIAENNKKLEELKKVVAQQPIEENEELQMLDFRVYVTQRQKFALREFLKANNIKFEPVPKQ